MPDQTKFTLPDTDMLSPIRAEYSLRETDVAAFCQGFTESQDAWSLERHKSYDGDLTVMLTPPGEAEATLVVSRDEDGFHLAACQGDDYQDLGSFESMSSIMSVLATQADHAEAPIGSVAGGGLS